MSAPSFFATVPSLTSVLNLLCLWIHEGSTPLAQHLFPRIPPPRIPLLGTHHSSSSGLGADIQKFNSGCFSYFRCASQPAFSLVQVRLFSTFLSFCLLLTCVQFLDLAHSMLRTSSRPPN